MLSKKLHAMYLLSPITLQNILITLKGLIFRLRRNRKFYRISKVNIASHDEWKINDYTEFQNKMFKCLILNAYNNTSFYKTLYDRSGVNIADISGISQIDNLPIVEKEDIKKNSSSLLSKKQYWGKKHSIYTTGTTGTPLNIYTCSKERQLNYAYFDNWLESIGLNPHKRHIIIGGRIIVSQNQNSPPYWRNSYFQNSLLFSSYHITEESCREYINCINLYKPEYIESYPSSIYLLAVLSLKKNLKIFSPKAIITSAETLFEEQREVIEKAFKCKVYDQYGAAEMCVFIAQCKNGSYHIRPDYAIVEFVGNGPYKELICTSLINYTMPLIRYRIGDSVLLGEKKCSCGLNTPIIEKIIGRRDDFVYTIDGKAIGRLSPVLKGLPIIEAQYVQRKIGHLEIHIVKDNGYNNVVHNNVINEVKKRVGKDMHLQIVYKEKIDRSLGPKNKSVINLSGYSQNPSDNKFGSV